MADQVQKKKHYNIFLWWKVDPEELNNQIVNYHKLGLFSAARKVSAMLLVLSAAMTGLFIALKFVPAWALVDCWLFLFLATFISQGHRWAAVCAMILWSVEKANMIVSGGPGAAAQILWWAAYMKYFFLTYKVGRNPPLPKQPTSNMEAAKTG